MEKGTSCTFAFLMLMITVQSLAQTKEITKTFTVEGSVVITPENIQPDNCYFGSGDGFIEVSVSGGQAPYTYEWFDNGGTPLSTDEILTDLLQGDYSLTVTDQLGCSVSETFSVGYDCPYTCSTSMDINAFDAATCSSGNGEITVLYNGTGPYTYEVLLYSPYTETSVLFESGTQPVGSFSLHHDYTSHTVNPGTYFITVEDIGTGCTKQETAVVGNSSFYFYDIFFGTNGDCIAPNGTIAFNIIDPTLPNNYSIKWKRTDNGTEDSEVISSTGHAINDLATGFYLIQAEDLDNPGCYINAAGSIGSYMAALDVTLDEITSQSNCSPPNGSIAVTVTGGSGNYGFTWTGPVTAYTEDISGIPAGDYTFSVYDYVSGCQQGPSTPTFTVDNTTVLPGVSIISQDNTHCSSPFNGTFDLTASATPGPYSYEWTNSVGDIVSTSEDVSGLPPGDYTVVVTDMPTGCVHYSYPVINDVSTPDPVISEVVNPSTACASLPGNGAINLTIASTHPYANTWNGPAGFTSSAEDITLLEPGDYILTLLVDCNLTVNQAPVMSGTQSSLTFGSAPVILDGNIIVTDDGATLTSATIRITSGFFSGEDILSCTSASGISVVYSASTGILSLSGSASLSSYQTALRSVTYQNLNTGDRNKNPRTIIMEAYDGTLGSNILTTTINLPNQLPAIQLTQNPLLYGSGATTLANDLTLTDADNLTLQSATVSITSGLTVSEDQLLFTNQSGITGTHTITSGILQLTGSATKADYQTALRSVQYQNTASTPSETSRTISVLVNDGMNNSTTAIVTVMINRAPVITAPLSVIEAGERIEISIPSMVTDPDNNLDLTNINSIEITVQPFSGAIASLTDKILSIDYSEQADFTGTDHLTIKICDNLDRCASQELSIEVEAALQVHNAVSPNNDNRNEFLFLRYISPQNKVTIFNRWGDKVFERKDYTNTDGGKRFEGRNDNGAELPSGTYFYKIEHAGGMSTGYLSLKR
jgi:gliding motility-associated-like protein